MTEGSSNERVKINKKIGAGAESGGVEGGGGTEPLCVNTDAHCLL